MNQYEAWKNEANFFPTGHALDELAGKTYEDLSRAEIFRLKWNGMIPERQKDGHFMVRIKFPAGRLTSDEADAISHLAEEYGDGSLQITKRQCMQIHHVTWDKLPELSSKIRALGMTTQHSSGDIALNITGDPLMGVNPDERLDVSSLIEEIDQELSENAEFQNLPRKIRICISSDPHDDAQAEYNDICFTPAVLTQNGQSVDGFHMSIGGGVSGMQHRAETLRYFILPEQVKEATLAVVRLFRDFGSRDSRTRSPFRYLAADWRTAGFEERLGSQGAFRLTGGEAVKSESSPARLYGVHPQEPDGTFFAGASVPAGRLSAEDFRTFSQLARRYANGQLRLTVQQSILIPSIPQENVDALKKEELFRRYALNPGMISGYGTACTGNTYCPFASVSSKDQLLALSTELERRFPELDRPFRLAISGCPASCAQVQTADIGLIGCRVKVDGRTEEGFRIWAGGSTGTDAQPAVQLKGTIPASQAADLLAAFLQQYLKDSERSELFYQYVRRAGADVLQNILDQVNAADGKEHDLTKSA